MLFVALIVAGCGSVTDNSDSAPTGPTRASTTTLTGTDTIPAGDLSGADAALASFAGGLGEDAVYSATTSVDGGAVAVVTFGAIQQIDVVRFVEGSWAPITRFSMSSGNVDATNFGVVGPGNCAALCIEMSALTGAPDFLVPVPGADQIQLAVVEVEQDATAARLVPFDRAGELQSAVRSRP